MKTKVIFRQWADKSLIALFPELNADCSNCMSYMSVGQHGAADCQGVINQTFPAKDYRSLQKELESIGYILDVKIRYTYAMRNARLKNYKEGK